MPSRNLDSKIKIDLIRGQDKLKRTKVKYTSRSKEETRIPTYSKYFLEAFTQESLPLSV